MNPEPFPLKLADRCVMCGLCIPHCPTYRLHQTENESPRGRIALMQGLARGQLRPTPSLLAHLDHCLECRACERACPSGVPYGRLMDASRAGLPTAGRTHWSGRLLGRLLTWPGPRLDGLGRLLYRLQALRLTGLLRLGGKRLRRLHALLPALPRPRPTSPRLYPADVHVPTRGQVSLFRGCAGRLFDRETADATLFLLNRLGYVVSVPAGQGCCGALPLHAGDRAGATALARTNLQAFDRERGSHVITTASACAVQLQEYPLLLGEAAAFAPQVSDIGAFLDRAEWPARYRFDPLPGRVAVHEPCLQRNVMKDDSSTYRLLQRIPGLTALPLPGNEVCCGAAGSHMLDQPQQADALLEPKLDALAELGVTQLVTTNIGCALHIQAGLRRRGLVLEVVHPVTLLARQLRTA